MDLGSETAFLGVQEPKRVISPPEGRKRPNFDEIGGLELQNTLFRGPEGRK